VENEDQRDFGHFDIGCTALRYSDKGSPTDPSTEVGVSASKKHSVNRTGDSLDDQGRRWGSDPSVTSFECAGGRKCNKPTGGKILFLNYSSPGAKGNTS
jgi:hypothetical protein